MRMLRAVAGLFHIFVGDRVCSLCPAETNKVTNRQYDQFRDTGILRCACGGLLLPRYDTRLRELLTLAANTVHPEPGLDGIQARTTSTPSAGTPEADHTTQPTR